MTKYVYTTKNLKSGNFNVPQFHDFKKEDAAEVFAISAREIKDVEMLKELDVYYLGTFDTKTGVFTSEVEFVLSLASVLGDKDGGQSKES